MHKVTAEQDPELSVQILRATPMEYREGKNDDIDRPSHVRAASSIANFQEFLVVVQDDANFLALVEKDYHHVQSVPLPSGPQGQRVFSVERGNIEHKLDLEACAAVPEADGKHLVGMASGSDPSREWILYAVLDDTGNPDIDLIEANKLYSYLRDEKDFCGSGLNVEGAIFDGKHSLQLFQRGNSDPENGLQPVDAVARISWPDLEAHLEHPDENEPPEINDIVQYELGELEGIRLTFSDAEKVNGHTLYSASAEASDDSDHIAGSALGILDEDSARWAEVIDMDGSAFEGKIEGLVTAENNPHLVYFVIDDDQPDQASNIYKARLEGPWYE